MANDFKNKLKILNIILAGLIITLTIIIILFFNLKNDLNDSLNEDIKVSEKENIKDLSYEEIEEMMNKKPTLSYLDLLVNSVNRNYIKELRDSPRSKLTGEPLLEEKYRNMIVVFDNFSQARPQAGISNASIMYEFLAEGNITRYVGVFEVSDDIKLGPIRSARPYMIEKALEFDGYFIHAGGSPQAFQDISNYNIASVSFVGPSGGNFWRESHKKAPHNVYINTNNIVNSAETLNYRSDSDYRGFKFYPNRQKINGEACLEVNIKYQNNYNASYVYNNEKYVYERYYNGSRHIDELNSKPIDATNIIIQRINTSPIAGDTEGRLNINTIGKGDGYLLTLGEKKKIHWEKTSYESPTIYYYENGDEIELNIGRTWIQHVPNYEIVDFK